MSSIRLTEPQRRALRNMLDSGDFVKVNRRTVRAIERAGIRLGQNSSGAKVWRGEEDRARFAADTGLVYPLR